MSWNEPCQRGDPLRRVWASAKHRPHRLYPQWVTRAVSQMHWAPAGSPRQPERRPGAPRWGVPPRVGARAEPASACTEWKSTSVLPSQIKIRREKKEHSDVGRGLVPRTDTDRKADSGPGARPTCAWPRAPASPPQLRPEAYISVCVSEKLCTSVSFLRSLAFSSFSCRGRSPCRGLGCLPGGGGLLSGACPGATQRAEALEPAPRPPKRPRLETYGHKLRLHSCHSSLRPS